LSTLTWSGLKLSQLESYRWAIHNVFNEDLLTCCKKTEFASQHKDPELPPDIINEEEEYEVEEIREHCKKGKGM